MRRLFSLLVLLVGCEATPNGCPLPKFIPIDSTVTVDGEWTGTLVKRVKVDCGKVTYLVRDKDGVEHKVEDTHLTQ